MKIEDIMNSGRILLADLSTGKIGEDNSALLGSMLITKIQLAAMGRTRIAETERRDFYLYVDEFQNFATDSFATILSEARKYRLNLAMVNQYISQMPETVKDAVFGNVGTMVSFRVGASDAEAMQKEFEPVFDVNDLVNLPNRQIYIKMAIDGVTVPAFSASTLPPPEEKSNLVKEVVQASREQSTTPRPDVEDYISDWSAPIDLSVAEAVKTEEPKVQGVPLNGPGNEKPLDKGFGEPAPKTAEAAALPPGKKIEILKDRFARSWYAVSDTAPQSGRGEMERTEKVEVTPPVREGVAATETAPILEAQLAAKAGESPDEKTAALKTQSRGDRGEEAVNHLITWQQAEDLGLTEEGKPAPKQPSNDMLPIDEL
jgi:hypothetical protein